MNKSSKPSQEATALTEELRQLIERQVRERIELERQYLMTALKIAGYGITIAIAILTFVGIYNIQDLRKFAQESAKQGVADYLTEETALPEIEQRLDEMRVRAVASFHLGPSGFRDARSLTREDADRLLRAIADPSTDDALFADSVRVLSTGKSSDWWSSLRPKAEGLVVRRSGSSILERPERAARVIDLLADAGSRSLFDELRPIALDEKEPEPLRVAVLNFATLFPKSMSTVDIVKAVDRANSVAVEVAAVGLLCLLEPENAAIDKFVAGLQHTYSMTIPEAVGLLVSLDQAREIIEASNRPTQRTVALQSKLILLIAERGIRWRRDAREGQMFLAAGALVPEDDTYFFRALSVSGRLLEGTLEFLIREAAKEGRIKDINRYLEGLVEHELGFPVVRLTLELPTTAGLTARGKRLEALPSLVGIQAARRGDVAAEDGSGLIAYYIDERPLKRGEQVVQAFDGFLSPETVRYMVSLSREYQ